MSGQDDAFVQKIVKAIREEQSEEHRLHHEWIRVTIEAEKQRIAFRNAIIEKTLGGLILAGALGLVALIWMFVKEYAINHGMWKP